MQVMRPRVRSNAFRQIRSHLALLKRLEDCLLDAAGFERRSLLTPEAIEIVGQTEQKSLFALGGERTTGRFAGEFAFDRAEDSFNMHTLPIALGRESSAHLRTHSMNFPTCLAALSGNDALRAQLLADMPVVALAVEFGIGQHRPNETGGHRVLISGAATAT